uniref:Probable G-protein coupled receptor 33 n=1 Tax=Chelydra serpentina TaxID=8475 RepID=A0A8C3XTJ2_CHESE
MELATLEGKGPCSPEPAMANSSNTPETMKTPPLTSAVLLFITFLVGLVGNGLYLWVLGLKTRRTVTTFWFLHLVSCYLLFTLLIPFFAIYVLLDFHWVFGTATCKFLNACVSVVMRTVTTLWFLSLVTCYLLFTLMIPFFIVYLLMGFHWVFGTAVCKLLYTFISVAMFTSVFHLTLISLDRYILTHHPIWSRNHRTLPRAGKLVLGVWLASFGLSTPYLFVRETRLVDGDRIICINNYTLSGDRNGAETGHLDIRVHEALFLIEFLLGFLLPFCTIVGCYVRVVLKMKEKKLAWAGKPFKVMVTSVVSFFLGWLPYHLYYGLQLFKNEPELVRGPFLVIYSFSCCFNACFSPILYLFMGEKFWQVFKTSLVTLVKAAFVDDLGSSGPESSGRQGYLTVHKPCSVPGF